MVFLGKIVVYGVLCEFYSRRVNAFFVLFFLGKKCACANFYTFRMSGVNKRHSTGKSAPCSMSCDLCAANTNIINTGIQKYRNFNMFKLKKKTWPGNTGIQNHHHHWFPHLTSSALFSHFLLIWKGDASVQTSLQKNYILRKYNTECNVAWSATHGLNNVTNVA